MKLIRYRVQNQTGTSVALWNRRLDGWVPITSPEGPESGDLLDILSRREEVEERVEKGVESGSIRPLDPEKIVVLPPIESPSKILCVGLNYADHAKEFGDPIPSEPVFFCKAGSTLTSHLAPIFIPKVSYRIDYEAELVVVIGKEGRFIPEKDSLSYVAGFTCGNDVSCRDWQKGKPGGQWFLGKSFDSFAPVGPALVTPDEIPDPNHLRIESRLNGATMQSSNTEQFIFPVETLISYVSQVMTLYPGDLIFTGTPGGIGDRRDPPVYLKAGDSIEVEIEKVGRLINRVEETP